MEVALAELASVDHGNVSAMARKHGVNRSTLSKRFGGKTSSLAEGIESHRFLNNV
jgi:transposase-like protein